MHFDIAHSLAKARLMMAESSHFDIAHGLAMVWLMLAESSHFDRAPCGQCRAMADRWWQSLCTTGWMVSELSDLSAWRGFCIFCPPGL